MSEDAGKIKGLIADLQRCSVHDGPGLRTTVFVKGCQLCCAWCHNPETISFQPEEMRYPDKCIGCGECDKGCFSGARVICGKEMTVSEVMEEVLQDKPYYGKDGGITISGGEPLCRPAFTEALISECRRQGIHTAVESNLCLPADRVIPILKQCSLVMADLKLWDEEAHIKWTGSPNGYAKENFRSAAEIGIPMILRTPVVPGVNDSEDEIRSIARFAAGLKSLLYYELLAYHPLGVGKAEALGRPQQRFPQPSKEDMLRLAAIAADEGLKVTVNNRVFDGQARTDSGV
jgi:pyruvate formate lyase activating enzyme